MIKYIAVFSLILIAYSNVLAGGKNNFNLVGEWFGEAPNGDKVTYVFKKDGNVDWIIDTKVSQGGTIKAKYKTDSSKKPITIDIFDFDNEQMKNLHWVGIIKFIEKNKLLIRGNIDSQVGRPTNFESEAIELTRE